MGVTVVQQLANGEGPPYVPLTVHALHSMLESGVLAAGAPLELIDGILVLKDRSDSGDARMTHGKRHALAVALLQRLDRRLDGMGCHLRVQLPVTLSATSEPEPDVSIARGVERDYAARHPGPGDLAAVIEVSDRSLSFDRGAKLGLYASAGVPAYAIVNIPGGVVELYQEPDPGAGLFAKRTVLARGDVMLLPVLDGTVRVPIEDILP